MSNYGCILSRPYKLISMHPITILDSLSRYSAIILLLYESQYTQSCEDTCSANIHVIVEFKEVYMNGMIME